MCDVDSLDEFIENRNRYMYFYSVNSFQIILRFVQTHFIHLAIKPKRKFKKVQRHGQLKYKNEKKNVH